MNSPPLRNKYSQPDQYFPCVTQEAGDSHRGLAGWNNAGCDSVPPADMSLPKHMLPLSEHAKYRENVKNGMDGNLVLPHSIEAGDPYYIGDVYKDAPSACWQEWELADK